MKASKKDPLKKILLAAAPSFLWITEEAKVFPNIIYGYKTIQFHTGVGKKERLFICLFIAKVYIYFLIFRPRIILLATVDKSVRYFSILKEKGLLPGVKLVFYSHCSFGVDGKSLIKYISTDSARQLDRIIYYAKNVPKLQDPSLKNKFSFVSWYAPGNFDFQTDTKDSSYIFSGGFSDRDFKSLIQAVDGVDVMLKIETGPLAYKEDITKLSSNCQVRFRDEAQFVRTTITPKDRKGMDDFLKIMAGSLFVVVPLYETLLPRGLTMILQALRLGKPVITTTNPGLDSYIADGKEGIRVPPGDVKGYRHAILSLLNYSQLRKKFSDNAKIKAEAFTAKAAIGSIIDLCKKEL